MKSDSHTLNSSEIRSAFLEFFKKRGHAILPSASLVTTDEKGVTNSTLFNTAGMQPLVPYLLGQPHPLGTRLADAQKCLRTVDIDDIGDKIHGTFFEMLGNWSLGDYFKKEAINWSYEFLTSPTDGPVGERGLGFDPRRLYITVFEGDSNAPRDEEAANIWKEVFKAHGITDAEAKDPSLPGRIFYMPANKNWWEAGDNGPCGPDTEMYYDVKNVFGGKPITHEQFIHADSDDVRDVVEVWNDVFMQYEKKDGKIVGKLPKPSVDTGAGLERLTMTIQQVDSIYETDLLSPAMELVRGLAKDTKRQRVIVDHLRAASFLITDGVVPSNTDRGYILRRLIRRAVINTDMRRLEEDDIANIIGCYVEVYGVQYPELRDRYPSVVSTLVAEITKFETALDIGAKEFEKIAKNGNISGADAFKLFSSFGLPIDVLKDLAIEMQISIDVKGFEEEFKKHQELSRVGAEKKFKGGLADSGDDMVIRYHTATHLLHQALRDILGPEVGQKGSNITTERLRFDFSFPRKMTDDEKMKVEQIINEKIRNRMPVNNVVLSKEEAEKTGALHFFGEKYGDQVSIYYVGPSIQDSYSKEFCGGPHVKNTAELAGPGGIWTFKIAKEEAVSQGVRRIKAVLS